VDFDLAAGASCSAPRLARVVRRLSRLYQEVHEPRRGRRWATSRRSRRWRRATRNRQANRAQPALHRAAAALQRASLVKELERLGIGRRRRMPHHLHTAYALVRHGQGPPLPAHAAGRDGLEGDEALPPEVFNVGSPRRWRRSSTRSRKGTGVAAGVGRLLGPFAGRSRPSTCRRSSTTCTTSLSCTRRMPQVRQPARGAQRAVRAVHRVLQVQGHV